MKIKDLEKKIPINKLRQHIVSKIFPNDAFKDSDYIKLKLKSRSIAPLS